MTAYHPFITGFLIAISLIMAIGAQNAFVLGQSLKREHHLSVALVCMSCDAILILAGIFGLASLMQQHPVILEATRWGGILFLLGYATLALLRACKPRALQAEAPVGRSWRQVMLATLAVTLLNPHVYLDTMVLIGTVGAQQSQPGLFALGAVSASATWFTALALGGSLLAPWLNKPGTWRAIDLVVAAMMLAVAWGLFSGGSGL